MIRVDLTGQRFGRLLVLGFNSVRGNGESCWNCLCDCGNTKVVRRGNLKNGTTKSCGCLQKEATSTATKKFVEYDLSGEYGVGYTVNTQTPFYFDLEDFDNISSYGWFLSDQGYVVAGRGDGKMIRMHRLVSQITGLVDHINNNRCDNRKSNLREATKQQNGINRGPNKNNRLGVKGVSVLGNKYVARITKDGKSIHLGVFDTLELAINARKNAECELFGEFAYQGGDADAK